MVAAGARQSGCLPCLLDLPAPGEAADVDVEGEAMRVVVSEIEMTSEPGGEVIGYERSTSIETAPLGGGGA